MKLIFRYIFDVEARERVHMVWGNEEYQLQRYFDFHYGGDERYVLLDNYYPWALLEGGIKCIK